MNLEIGYKKATFEVRKERLDGHFFQKIKILFLSDLHFNGYSEKLLLKIKQTIETMQPNLILLGGDYVDTQSGLVFFKHLCIFLGKYQHVFLISGNHDYFWGLEKLKKNAVEQGLVWMEKTSLEIEIEGQILFISNNKDCKPKENALSILCLHKPCAPKRIKEGYDLIFAGHLHGGQVVFWQNNKGLYPARFFYKQNFLKAKINNSLYLVSKGLGDTLPLRFNCPKDMILVEIRPKA